MYDYKEEMREDIKNYIRDNYTNEELTEKLEDREDFQEELNDALFVTDSVTGNASGSYTFNRWKAQEFVTENLDTLREALREFGTEAETIAKKFLDEDWEYFDVTIRCYLLKECMEDVLDELTEEMEASEEE